MSKKLTVFIGGIIIVTSFYGVTIFGGNQDGQKIKIEEKVSANELKQEEVNKPIHVKVDETFESMPHRVEIDAAKEFLGINEGAFEEHMEDIIHQMTHQKVRAQEKSGYIQMTKANIWAVHEVVTENGYNELAEHTGQWILGDFLRVDEAHNYVWKKQGGTVGKAFGILSASEEAEVVAEQFPE